MWTPSSADAFKTATAMAAREAVPAEVTPINGPFRVVVAFYLRRPQRLMRKSSEPGAIPCESKPDLDNLLKSLLDAMVDGGIVRDDAALYSVSAGKYYAEIGEAPRAEVWLYTNTDEVING